MALQILQVCQRPHRAMHDWVWVSCPTPQSRDVWHGVSGAEWSKALEGGHFPNDPISSVAQIAHEARMSRFSRVHSFSGMTVKTCAKALKSREKQRMIHVWPTYDLRTYVGGEIRAFEGVMGRLPITRFVRK